MAFGFGFNYGFGNGESGLQPEELGEIFSDNFARASLGANYTIVGTASFSPDGNSLILTGGTGSQANLMYRNDYDTCAEKWTQVIDFTLPNGTTGTSYGLGLGVYGNNQYDQRGSLLQINLNDGFVGVSFIHSAQGVPPNYTTRFSHGTGLAISEDDLCRVTLVRNKNTYSYTLQNLTTSGSYSDSFTFPLTYGSPIYAPHANGHFSMHTQGGTISVTNWSVTINNNKNVKVLYIGDSIAYGLWAEDVVDRWVDNITTDENNYTVSAGLTDTTETVLARIDELISFNPTYAVLCVGGNDDYFIPFGTRNANYTSIRNQLNAAGITVIHCLNSPRDGLDMTSLNTHINTFSGTDTVIDTFTPFKGAGTDLHATYDSGDGTHGNALFHSTFADIVRTAVPNLI